MSEPKPPDLEQVEKEQMSPLSDDDSAFEASMINREINGRFKIIRLIGHGGFGSVFLAHQMSVDRHVAIKILRPSWVENPQMAQRFLIEAKATSQLQSPHTVTVFDFGETEDKLLYIAMEYLQGKTLHDRIHENPPLNIEEAVTIVGQVADSLAEAHGQEIVHRDLKPENIFLVTSRNNELFVKVLDFGIARSKPISEGLNLTITGQFSGTPAYMSPEVIRSKTVGPTSDVYSMGILLYQMLAGRCPFDGDNPFDVLTQHVSARPTRIRQFNDAIPVRLELFIEKCLSKRPQKRPEDAASFLEELRTIERTELAEGKFTHKPLPKQKPSSSAATLAVVEDTEEALRFSRSAMRWMRTWINTNPVPVTLGGAFLGFILATVTVFLDPSHDGQRLQLPIAAASVFTPQEVSIEEPKTPEDRVAPKKELPLNVQTEEQSPSPESIERKSETVVDEEEKAESETSKTKRVDLPPKPSSTVKKAKAKASKGTKPKFSKTKKGEESYPTPKERRKRLMGDSTPAANSPPPKALDKVDAFLD